MMNKRISILSIERPFERIALQGLFIVFAVLVATYLYFVGASVLNIIARTEANAEGVRLRSAIAGMEKEYFALKADVGPLAAAELGLAPVSQTAYVYRPGNAAAVTIGSNEI
ncbi:MAG TPA: hypothetical protein VJH91_00300 [Candidatus Paceibacterota bacterium]